MSKPANYSQSVWRFIWIWCSVGFGLDREDMDRHLVGVSGLNEKTMTLRVRSEQYTKWL